MHTTLEHLAAAAEMPIDIARDGLDGLMYRDWATVLRRDTQLGRRDLVTVPDHARIKLVIDWSSVEREPDDDPDEEPIIWQGAPWVIYQGVAADPCVSKNARDVLGYMQSTFRKPTGGTFLTCLVEMAAEQGTSISAAAGALSKLETAGLLCWHADEQLAELAGRPDQFARA